MSHWALGRRPSGERECGLCGSRESDTLEVARSSGAAVMSYNFCVNCIDFLHTYKEVPRREKWAIIARGRFTT